MNQIFRITVGQDTLHGRLPAVRVAKGFCSRFHIYGLAHSEEAHGPKIWVTTADDTLYWTGAWSQALGVWVVEVNTDATQAAGSKNYALTVFDESGTNEYLAGQGSFTVFSSIADPETGMTGGTAGQSLSARVTVLEAWMESFEDLPMFDPVSAYDIDLRNQMQTVTNKLRGAG